MAPSPAAQRPGAVRTIQIRWGEPFPGSLLSPDIGKLSISRAVFGVASSTGGLPTTGLSSWRLFFTVEANGTRNLWQAVPEAPSTDANAAAERSGSIPNLRNVIWHATPLTRLSVPYFADEAAPTPDGRALLFVTNADPRNADTRTVGAATPASQTRQIARLDLATGRWAVVTTLSGRHSEPSIAPDGEHFAFVSDRSGMEAIYVRSMGGGSARRVATLARHPVWLDNSTLLYENIRPGQSGIYRLSLGRALRDDNAWSSLPRPRQLFARAGESAVAHDGRLLCIAAEANGGNESDSGRQLFMLAPDGSGARSIVGTAGARSPSFAPDGQLIVFDAPLPSEAPQVPKGTPAKAASEARTVWLMPMLRVLPSAQVLEVRASERGGPNADEIDIIGTAFAEEVGPLEARLEFAAATDPQRWRSLPVNPLPVHAGVLATWKPPAQGDWLLRLSVVDAAGDSAQSTLALTWPLPPPVVQEAPPPIFDRPLPDDLLPAEPATVPPPRPVPVLPLPALPPAPVQSPPASAAPVTAQNPPPAKPAPAPRSTPAVKAPPSAPRAPRTPSGSQLPILPLPALPAPPTTVAPGTPATPSTPAVAVPAPRPPVTTVPTAKPATLPPAVVAPSTALPAFPAPSSAPATVPPPAVPRRDYSAPAKTPPARPAQSRAATPAFTPAVRSGSDRGTIRVSGTPAVLSTGEKVPVEVLLTNTGRQGWGTQGAPPVRLIYHWVNLDSGTRVRWYIEWLTAPVAPGATLKMAFNLSAPPRPGRYRLTYTLVRLKGNTYEPPAYNASQSPWPGEFGATSYRVSVK